MADSVSLIFQMRYNFTYTYLYIQFNFIQSFIYYSLFIKKIICKYFHKAEIRIDTPLSSLHINITFLLLNKKQTFIVLKNALVLYSVKHEQFQFKMNFKKKKPSPTFNIANNSANNKSLQHHSTCEKKKQKRTKNYFYGNSSE